MKQLEAENELEFAYDRLRNSAAIRFRLWKKDNCVEVDFPDGGEPMWTYLTREQARKVIEFLQRFSAMP